MTVGSNFNDKTRFEAAYIHARETMQSDTGRTLVEMMKTMHTRCFNFRTSSCDWLGQ